MVYFRMDIGSFDEKILKPIGSLGCWFAIKEKAYPTFVTQAKGPNIIFGAGKMAKKPRNLSPH